METGSTGDFGSKLSGPRELNIAASPRMHDLEEEHMPHTWNRREC